jgi:LPS export ABC transporter permease LptG
MRLLNRYLRGEIMPAVLLGLLLYTSLFLVRAFLEVSELSLRHGIPLYKSLFIILLGFPSILGVTIPMAVLYGVLFAVSKMQAGREILAFYSLGFSRKRVMVPIIASGMAFVLLNLIIMVYILPWSNSRLVRYRLELLQSSLTQNVQAKTFLDSFPGKILFMREISENKRLWRDVIIFDYSQPLVDQVLCARRGELYLNPDGNQIWLKLLGSRNLLYSAGQKYQVNFAGEQDLLLYPPWTDSTATYAKGFRERTMEELVSGMGSTDDRLRRRSAAEFHKRLAIPATTLVFLFLAFALGLRRTSAREAGRGPIFVLSLLIILSDYIFLTLGENLAVEGKIAAGVALWAPVLGFGMLAAAYAMIPSFRFPPLPWRGWAARIRLRGLPQERDLRRAFPFVLDAYLLRTWLPFLLLGIATIMILYVGVDFSQLADDVQRHQVPLRTVAAYYLFSLPQVTYDYILPLAALGATALALTALERHRELSALKSLGISWQRVAATFMLTVVAFGALLFAISEVYLPLSNRKMLELRKTILAKPARAKVGRFFSRDLYLSGSDGWIYRYSGYDQRNALLYNLNAFRIPPGGELDQHWSCAQAQFQAGRWVTPDGWVRTIRPGPTVQYDERKDAVLPIPDTPALFGQVLDEPRMMNALQLAGYIRALRGVGYNPVEWQVRLWQKILYPWFLALLVLLALVATLAGLRSGSPWAGLGRSILVGLVLWASAAVCAKLGDLGALHPLTAALTPLIAFTALGTHRLLAIRS